MSSKTPLLLRLACVAFVGTAACSDDGGDDGGGNGDPVTDADMDGVAASADCDDTDPMLGAIANDADCDGVPTTNDCDDGDDMVGSNVDDLDCDMIPTAQDCDDMDAMVGSNANDMDCDMVPTAQDCDDMDDMVGSNANDMDCDMIPTAQDCDDMDAMVGSNANDMDCDTIPTAQDCDDMDAMIGSNADDMDCDMVPTAQDCDDMDAMAGPIADDTDCDGALNEQDECPDDADFVEAPAPVLDRRFPGQFSATTVDEIEVSGSVSLGCGGTTLDTISASVGGTPANVQTQMIDASTLAWTLTAPLSSDADNVVSVSAVDSRGRMGSVDSTIQQYQPPQPPPTELLQSSQGIDVDPATDTAYVADEALQGVYAVDLSTGITTVLSAMGVGTGPAFSDDLEGGIALDAGNGRLLVTDDGADSVIGVDLTTGNRTLVSGPNNTGPAFGIMYGIAVGTGRAFVADSSTDGIIAFDLTTGDRTLITSPSLGTGPDLTTPRDVDIDSANNRLLVVGTGADALVAVDLTTGNRTEISGPNVGMGVAFNSIRGVTFDAMNNLALVADAGNGNEGIVAVDLATGNRTEISGPNVGMTLSVGADFDSTRGVYIDQPNNRLLVVDDQITSLVAVDPGSGDRTLIEPAVPPPPGVGSGPSLLDPTGLVLVPDENALFVADDTQATIFRIDLSNGSRSVLADSTSMGVTLDSPRGLGIDAANERLLVPDNGLDAIVAVALGTGQGSIVSDDDSMDDMSETFGSPRGRAQIGPGGMAGFVADTARDSVFRFDLTTGERTTLAEAGDGPLEGVQTVDLDAANNRLVVSVASTGDDDVLDAVLAIDITSGAITTLSNRSTDMPAVGMGPDMPNPRGLALDLANDRALVFDADLDALFGVDLNSGNRTILSSATNGDGDFLVLEDNNTNSLELDPARQVVYAANETSDVIILIDLVSGDQVVISR